MLDFIRVAAAVPDLAVADTEKNVSKIIEKIDEADKNSVQLAVFPELCITGYTCADLFFQKTLLKAAADGLKKIILHSRKSSAVIAVGLPIEFESKLFNCAAIIYGGKLYGLIPKTYIPNYNEFYEERWFSSGCEIKSDIISAEALGISDIQSEPVSFRTDILFDTGNFVFAAEICEDLWSAVPPSNYLTLAGSEVIINLSASNETVSKRKYRKSVIEHLSASQMSAYVYASAGCGESTTDLIFSGHGIICENGRIVAENQKMIDNDYLLISDIDLGKIRHDRLKNKTYAQCAEQNLKTKEFKTVKIPTKDIKNDLSFYKIEKLPFVPSTKTDRTERCLAIFEMQVMGLKKRMEVTNSKPVIGVSGGLDSTLALLVCTEAAKRCGRPLSDVVGITMPCFGTTDRTYNNSLELMKSLGITYLEIPIKDAVLQHFKDIGQDKKSLDLTFENSQARERTQVLMDYAGRCGGFVVGTGDLSELALGWCTYNADHMSMYGVNCGIPKTLVRWLIESLVECDMFEKNNNVLKDILDTPISPELLPPDANGKIAQQTEDIVGPYALHDFFLYYSIRFGFSPEKIFVLAKRAFKNDFDGETVKKWLVTFYRRFFTQQFKRSCLPDGVKIGSICLSPRGDWRMPSDAVSKLWVKQAEELEV